MRKGVAIVYSYSQNNMVGKPYLSKPLEDWEVKIMQFNDYLNDNISLKDLLEALVKRELPRLLHKCYVNFAKEVKQRKLDEQHDLDDLALKATN